MRNTPNVQSACDQDKANQAALGAPGAQPPAPGTAGCPAGKWSTDQADLDATAKHGLAAGKPKESAIWPPVSNADGWSDPPPNYSVWRMIMLSCA
jgi:hypothetical protein